MSAAVITMVTTVAGDTIEMIVGETTAEEVIAVDQADTIETETATREGQDLDLGLAPLSRGDPQSVKPVDLPSQLLRSKQMSQ